MVAPTGAGGGITWWRLACGDLAGLVDADLHQTYGVDVDYDLPERCWSWWRSRVEQLLTLPPRVTPLPNGGALIQQRTRLGDRLQPAHTTK